MDEKILENVVEVVTRDELDSLVKDKKHPIVYCGFEVSGPVHIGHAVAVQKLVDFQEAGWKVKVLFADVHTKLNMKDVDVDEMTRMWESAFKKLGLGKTEFVRGSSFQFERNYIEDVLMVAQHSTLNRALRSMQEVARDIEHARTSQVIYPLMQAVDIKHLGVDVAYGGMEQRKIHMLAREILPELGCAKPVCIHTPLLPSIAGPDVKMSSSKPETMIAVDDSPEDIKKKISKAFCPPETEGNPVLDIARLVLLPRLGSLEVERPEKFGGNVTYESIEKIEEDYSSKKLHPADLKNTVSENLASVFEKAR